MTQNSNSNLIKALEKERDDFLNKARSMNDAIEILKSIQPSDNADNGKIDKPNLFADLINMHSPLPDDFKNKYKKYDRSATIRNKIVTIIKTENKFLHVREMAEIAHKLEPTISASDFMSKFSPTLSTLKNIPGSTITNFVVGKSNMNNFWGSQNWIDKDGNVKKEHMYDESQLRGNKTEQFII